MPENIEVKPAEGRRVRDCRTRHPLPTDVWSKVPRHPYFLRLLARGDLVERDAPAATEKTKRRRVEPAAESEEE